MSDLLTVSPSDEGRHEPGSEPLWGESWYFDFFSADGSVGGWVRIGLYPNLGVTWYHAYLVGPDRAIVAVADYEAPLPNPPGLELRTHGLWADHIVETPLEHVTVGNEAHGLGVDEPAALYAPVPVGDQVPLAFDLEWETAGVPYHYQATTRYEIPCTVHGTIDVGRERIDLDGFGQRDHSWGVRDWWQFGWVWTSGRLNDDTRFHGSDIRIPQLDVGFGYEQRGGEIKPTNSVHADEQTDAEGFATSGRVSIDELALTITPVAFAPALLEWEGRVSRFPRALCEFTAADGRSGLGWTEWNQPRL
ncbi:MAG TPA: hypothetical protein VGZ52_04880 [Acidimicrobiales bacterium]|jgi:hypothetical protein|nr:hypothetical protein [Acidimicrobiales bacterium]